MKYIKKFEAKKSYYYGEFWLVRTDAPYFELSLELIGFSKKVINYYLTNEYIKKQIYDRIYVAKSFTDNDSTEWEPLRHKKEFEQGAGYEYKGEIKPTEEEVKNFLIKKESEKYNL